MANPFTIRIFVPDGDPDGVRIIDRQSSPSRFFVFPRNKWSNIKNEKELSSAGVYILVGYSESGDDLPTVYVGQADNVKNRIEQHQKGKDFWDRAVIFVSENKINATHAKWLEYALVKQVLEAKRSHVENGNSPSEPTISDPEKAEMQVFLAEILQTLPIAGIKAFEKPEIVAKSTEVSDQSERNTIVVPANHEGFEEVFLGENAWYAIRISGGMLDQIKYIAGYQTDPISAITYYAEVSSIEPYGEDGKYKVNFASPAKKLERPIKREAGTPGLQNARYTNIERLLSAGSLSDAF